jgi:hypothetical protein
MKAKPAPTVVDSHDSSVGQFCDLLRDSAKKLAGLALRLRKKIDDPRVATRLLSDATPLFEDVAKLGSAAVQIADECEQKAEQGFLQLAATIQDLCAKHNWRLDGQWPDFMIDHGVPLHVDEKQRTIIIGGSTRVGPGELEKELANTTAGLIPQKFSPHGFMQQLQSAYDSAGAGSAQVPIYDVYRNLVIQQQSSRFWRDAATALFVPMSIDQFRARFSRMLEAGVGTTKDGRELRLYPPLNPKDAVFLYQPLERRFGFVGRIEFVKP